MTDDEVRQLARDKYAESGNSDDVEISEQAGVFRITDTNGAWVVARVWVDLDEGEDDA